MRLLSMISRRLGLGACAIAALVMCNSAIAAEKTFTIGGSISGLRGTGMVLSNGFHTATINTNGPFTFSTPLASGTAYNVTVVTRPSQPTQGCLILNGRGTLTANVTNVTLACVTSSYTVGGIVTGLSGSGLVLRNGTQLLTVNANGAFRFPTPVLSGATYEVAVETQPAAPAQTCTVNDGGGTIGGGNVTNVLVACAALPPPLRLLSSTPAPEATDVSRKAPIVLNFSAPLNAQTVDTARVALLGAFGNEQPTLSVAGSQVTMTPSMQLLPAMTHTAIVRTGVRGIDGETLGEDIAVRFATREASWRTSQLIGFAPVFPPSIGSRGDEFAVAWRYTNDSIGLRRYSPRSGWSDTAVLDRNTRAFIVATRVFLDAAGTAHVIYNNNYRSLEYTRHVPGSGWSPVEQVVVAGTDQRIGTLEAGSDAAGNIIVVWTDVKGEMSGTNNYDILAIRYAAGSGWGTPVQINDTNYFSKEPRLAVDAAGNAMALWQEEHYSGAWHSQLWSRRYAPGGEGWGIAQRVDVGNTVSAGEAQVAMSDLGQAVAVYTSAGNVMANSHDGSMGWGTSRGWGTPVALENIAGTSVAPQVAFAGSEAFVNWIQSGGSIYRNRRLAGLWSSVAEHVASATREFRDLRLAIDRRGMEILVVTDVTATSSSILALRNTSTPAQGWVRQTLELRPDATSRTSPQIAVDASGSALAIWFARYSGDDSVEAGIFE